MFVGAIPAAYFPKQIVVESNHRNRKKRRKVLNQGSTIIVNISIFLIALTEHEVTGNLSEAACTEDKEYFDDDYFAFWPIISFDENSEISHEHKKSYTVWNCCQYIDGFKKIIGHNDEVIVPSDESENQDDRRIIDQKVQQEGFLERFGILNGADEEGQVGEDTKYFENDLHCI